jgi:transposase
MAVMIGAGPHKGSHTAVAIGPAEEPLGQQRVRACPGQGRQLLAWAAAWPERTWAAGGATGLGRLLAQQLAAAGEQVLDIQPKLAARVRLLEAGDVNKNDPNDARSVAVAALRSRAPRPVAADDHAAVLKMWAKRHRDLARSRNQVACRLHAVLRAGPRRRRRRDHRRPGRRILDQVTPETAATTARHDLATEFLADLRRLDGQRRECATKLATAVRARGTSLTGLSGAGPVIAGLVIGDVPDVTRFPGRGHFAAHDGTAPGRGVLRRPEGLPAVAARQPAPQPRDPHGRDHPDPAHPQPGPRLLRPQDRRRQTCQGGTAVPQTADQRRHLRPPARRRPPSRRSGLEGPGRAPGERLCLQRGRLSPRTPALRISHSRAWDQPTIHGNTHVAHTAVRAAGEETRRAT